MRPRHCWCLLVALALPTASCTRKPAHPIADFPAQLDLGTRELGETAIAHFTVTNRGGAELVLDGFTSNCSCGGVEQLRGGEYVLPEAIRLEPGEQVELRMRLSVRGVPVGTRATNGVTLRTNDPSRPSARIEGVVSRVTGGVSTFPQSVVVGRVAVGSAVRHVIEVRDDAVTPRTLERVTSSRPERVTVRRIDGESGPPGDAPPGGTRIGLLEVTTDTRTPGDLDSVLMLHLAGADRKPDVVHVIGRVVPPIEISPPTIILPRASPDGPVYTANCLLRSADGKPLSVVVDGCPAGLTVAVPEPDEKSSAVVTLTVSAQPAAFGDGGAGREHAIQLRCRAGDRESVEELRVLLTHAESTR